MNRDICSPPQTPFLSLLHYFWIPQSGTLISYNLSLFVLLQKGSALHRKAVCCLLSALQHFFSLSLFSQIRISCILRGVFRTFRLKNVENVNATNNLQPDCTAVAVWLEVFLAALCQVYLSYMLMESGNTLFVSSTRSH